MEQSLNTSLTICHQEVQKERFFVAVIVFQDLHVTQSASPVTYMFAFQQSLGFIHRRMRFYLLLSEELLHLPSTSAAEL